MLDIRCLYQRNILSVVRRRRSEWGVRGRTRGGVGGGGEGAARGNSRWPAGTALLLLHPSIPKERINSPFLKLI